LPVANRVFNLSNTGAKINSLITNTATQGKFRKKTAKPMIIEENPAFPFRFWNQAIPKINPLVSFADTKGKQA
jgi:hypothetical protein